MSSVRRVSARLQRCAQLQLLCQPLGVIERHIIESRLDAFSGNKSQAAKSLGISLKTLYNRINTWRAIDAAERVDRYRKMAFRGALL